MGWFCSMEGAMAVFFFSFMTNTSNLWKPSFSETSFFENIQRALLSAYCVQSKFVWELIVEDQHMGF